MILTLAQLFDAGLPPVPALPDPPALEHYALENPWPGVIALAAFAAALVAVRQGRRWALPAAGALVLLAGGWYAAARATRTPREVLADRTRALIGAVAVGDPGAVGALLAEDARLYAFFTPPEGVERAAILARVESDLNGPYKLRSFSIQRVDAELRGPRVARTHVLVRVEPDQYRFQNLSWWKVDWRLDGETWRAFGIEPLAIQGLSKAGPRN